MLNSKKPIDQTSDSFASAELKSALQTYENPFIRASMEVSSEVLSGNGAIKLSTTGSDFVDDFGKMSSYKEQRTYNDIAKTMDLLWSQDKLLTLRIILYTRMITRQVQLFNGNKTIGTQRGQGLKHEGIYRMVWLARNHPETFWKNVTVFVSVGCWKDIFQILENDLENGWDSRVLDWDKFASLILSGLSNPNTVQLLKKYLPTIRTNKNCKTARSKSRNIIGKWIASLIFGNKDEGSTYKKYRKLKESGTAHEWQKLISQRKFELIDFSSIHGKALDILTKKTAFLQNQGLEERYEAWMAAKPILKFTGYPYEIFKQLGNSTIMSKRHLKSYQIETMNKQFYGIIETAKDGMIGGGNRFIGVLDTSGSMTSPVIGTTVSSYLVGKVMTLYLSYLLEGPFSGCYLEFNDGTVMKQWKGDNPVDQLCNENSSKFSATDFISVADHFGRMLEKGVSENDMPNGIVCFSDKFNCHLV